MKNSSLQEVENYVINPDVVFPPNNKNLSDIDLSQQEFTEVNFDGNKYYTIYQKYAKAKAEGKMKGVTVENIGGTECQKCHY